MEVRSGFKQTEVGIIPNDWDVKPLGDLFDFSGGYSASRDQLSTEGHCYLHYGDIHGSTKTFVDTRVDYQDIPKLNIPLKRVSSHSLLKDGDIVFVDASEDDDGTSKHVVVVNKDNLPFISGLHTIVAKSKTDELAHEYRRYCFQTAVIRQQFLFYAVGIKVSGISKSNIPKLFLPIPLPYEQRAIAKALSDLDALLGGLDRLIAKKRDLKQAAMQQLLTGQTRLPAFHGDWEAVEFGIIATIRNTKVLSSAMPVGTQCVELESIGQRNGRLLMSTDASGSSPKCSFKKGDILFGRLRAYLRKYWLATFDGICSTEIWPLFARDERLCGDFLYLLVQANDFVNAAGVSYGTHMPRSDWSVLEKYPVRLPTFPEQTAIASVLSDMDAELAALEARRDKTRNLKQAMMQELLTGKTRLI